MNPGMILFLISSDSAVPNFSVHGNEAVYSQGPGTAQDKG